MDNISANGLLSWRQIISSPRARMPRSLSLSMISLSDHNVLEGRIIRCSDDNGLFIVGCQMPEDNFYILGM